MTGKFKSQLDSLKSLKADFDAKAASALEAKNAVNAAVESLSGTDFLDAVNTINTSSITRCSGLIGAHKLLKKHDYLDLSQREDEQGIYSVLVDFENSVQLKMMSISDLKKVPNHFLWSENRYKGRIKSKIGSHLKGTINANAGFDDRLVFKIAELPNEEGGYSYSLIDGNSRQASLKAGNLKVVGTSKVMVMMYAVTSQEQSNNIFFQCDSRNAVDRTCDLFDYACAENNVDSDLRNKSWLAKRPTSAMKLAAGESSDINFAIGILGNSVQILADLTTLPKTDAEYYESIYGGITAKRVLSAPCIAAMLTLLYYASNNPDKEVLERCKEMISNYLNVDHEAFKEAKATIANEAFFTKNYGTNSKNVMKHLVGVFHDYYESTYKKPSPIPADFFQYREQWKVEGEHGKLVYSNSDENSWLDFERKDFTSDFELLNKDKEGVKLVWLWKSPKQVHIDLEAEEQSKAKADLLDAIAVTKELIKKREAASNLAKNTAKNKDLAENKYNKALSDALQKLPNDKDREEFSKLVAKL